MSWDLILKWCTIIAMGATKTAVTMYWLFHVQLMGNVLSRPSEIQRNTSICPLNYKKTLKDLMPGVKEKEYNFLNKYKIFMIF